MTEPRSERWLLASAAGSRTVRTRVVRADDGLVLEVEAGRGAEARTVTAEILHCSDDTCVVSMAGRATVVRLAPAARGQHAMADGEMFTVTDADDDESRSPERAATHAEIDHRAPRLQPTPRAGGDAKADPDADAPRPAAELDALAAPMPAAVAAILTRPGAVVKAGDVLVRLEAMKMELAIRAPSAGRVAAIDCRVGDLVQPGRPLVTLEP